jgi:hypothetical protein
MLRYDREWRYKVDDVITRYEAAIKTAVLHVNPAAGKLSQLFEPYYSLKISSTIVIQWLSHIPKESVSSNGVH